MERVEPFATAVCQAIAHLTGQPCSYMSRLVLDDFVLVRLYLDWQGETLEASQIFSNDWIPVADTDDWTTKGNIIVDTYRRQFARLLKPE